jgi:Flp pilus assembly protein TadD
MHEVTRILSAIEQGEPQAAEQLLPLSPKSADLFAARAKIHVEQRQWDKAIADFEKVCELQPTNASNYNALAWRLAEYGLPRTAAPSRCLHGSAVSLGGGSMVRRRSEGQASLRRSTA